jgi:hypothetical protein
MAAAWSYHNASGAVKGSPGMLVAAVLSAAGASEVTLKDGGASGAAMVNLRTAGAGTVAFCPALPLAFGTSLYLTVDSGTVEVTVAYI